MPKRVHIERAGRRGPRTPTDPELILAAGSEGWQIVDDEVAALALGTPDDKALGALRSRQPVEGTHTRVGARDERGEGLLTGEILLKPGDGRPLPLEVGPGVEKTPRQRADDPRGRQRADPRQHARACRPRRAETILADSARKDAGAQSRRHRHIWQGQR